MSVRASVLAAGLSAAMCSVGAADSTAISVSANGRYFVDGNDKPFLWLGDTQWDLFAAFSAQDARSVCEDRRNKGFSALQIMLYGVRGPGSANNFGQMPWVNNNPASLNDAYFAHVDSIVDVGHSHGLQMVVGIYHWRWGSITTNNARAMARAISTRYKDKPNIIWCMYPQATSSYTAIVNELIAGLNEGDNASHLVTVHPDASNPMSASFWQSDTRISFNTFQEWNFTYAHYRQAAADYARTPTKPVVDGEARYEGEDGTTAFQARQPAYWACLAGGFYSYGHGGNWQSPTSWQTWIDSPGSRQMKILGDLLRSISWWKLVPDQSVFSSSAGENAAARSSDGDWVLVYLSSNTSVTLNLAKITGSDSATAWWVNPTSGAQTKIGTYRATGTRAFQAPNGWQDAVLLLKKQDGPTAAARAVSYPSKHKTTSRRTVMVEPRDSPANVTVKGTGATTNVRGQRVGEHLPESQYGNR